MEKLLQWAVNNSNQEELKRQAEAIRRGELKADQSKFDPAVIEAILGKDDATRMKEAVDCIVDPNDTLENKEIALDNLEMLVEHIDNAMNVDKMKLWPPILEQLKSPEPAIRKGVAWVCGTAVQNNPNAQQAFLANNGLEPLVTLLREEKDKEVKAKVIYAISGLLKHCPEAVKAFKEKGGFEALQDIIKNTDDMAALRKVIFMYNSLMIENDDLASELLKHHALDDLDTVLVKYTGQDEDLTEKTLRTLATLCSKTSQPLPAAVKPHVQEAKKVYTELGLDESEWNTLLA